MHVNHEEKTESADYGASHAQESVPQSKPQFAKTRRNTYTASLEASRLAEVLICAKCLRGIPWSTPQAYAVGTLGLYIAKHFAADQPSRNHSRCMACSKGCASNHCKHLVHICTIMKDFGGALPRLGTQPCPASCFGCPGCLAVVLAALLAQDLWAAFEQAGQLLDSSRAGCGCPNMGL